MAIGKADLIIAGCGAAGVPPPSHAVHGFRETAMQRPGPTVLTGTLLNHMLIACGRATGVVYRCGGIAGALREAIVSAIGHRPRRRSARGIAGTADVSAIGRDLRGQASMRASYRITCRSTP